MKKSLLIIIAILSALPFSSHAQWTTSGTNIYNSNTGNVGINTTTPSEKLEVNFGNVRITHNDPGNRLMWYRSDNTHPTGFGSDGYSTLKFITNGTERMTLGGGGALGIGTTSPQELLDVAGNMRANRLRLGSTSSSNIRLWVNSDNAGSGTTDWIAGSLGGTAGDRVVMGLLYGVATIGSHNSSLNAWSNFAINPGGGNVGIGTSTPNDKLEVVGDVRFGAGALKLHIGNTGNALAFNRNTSTGAIFSNTGHAYQFNHTGISTTNTSDYLAMEVYNSSGGSVSVNAWVINGLGNIGIGTATPGAKLEVFNNAATSANGSQVLRLQANYSSAAGTGGYLSFMSGTAEAGRIRSFNESEGIVGLDFSTYNSGLNQSVMRISGNGNVGIGTTDPKGYKLAVNGSAVATSMTVKLYANWPDYVFKKDYQLPSLTSVQAYIDQNHHLPEMPSEQEVAKDGLNLGEMNRLLLKKVEELTLYLIQQKKETEQLRQRLEVLAGQVSKNNDH